MEDEDIPGPSRRSLVARFNREFVGNHPQPRGRSVGNRGRQNNAGQNLNNNPYWRSNSQEQQWRRPGIHYTTKNNPHPNFNQRSSSQVQRGNGRRQDRDGTGVNKNRSRGVGFLYLQELANSTDIDIILNVNKKYEALKELLQSKIERPDMFVLIMEIISKACASSFDRLKYTFLLDVCNSHFIIFLRSYLMDLPYVEAGDKRSNNMYWKNPNDFWTNLITFCEQIIEIAPSVAKSKCRSLVEDTSKLCLERLHELHGYSLPDELVGKLEALRETMKVVESETVKKRSGIEHTESEPPENFRELSVLPTRRDLLEMKPFVRPNVINGAYRDVEHYLDVQFRLLREDCFGPLREGLLQYINEPTKSRYDNIRIYRNVKFVSPYISNNKFGALIEVDSQTKRRFSNIKWSYSKRFIFGSLLLLTKDNCTSFITVTILDREVKYLNNGQIPVEIMNMEIGDEIYNNDHYVMIESEVYFEPYQHVLKALQDPNFPEQLAMKKYIVDVDIKPTYPEYLNEDTEYEANIVDLLDDIKPFSVMKFETWPSMEELGLNNSQYEAYKVALTHEFGVIQGPPGTGKTFLGVKIAETLLRNVNVRSKCKMLLVCYTNHALDQFLEALLPFTDSIARVGGQSRNESLDKFNLHSIRKNTSIKSNSFYDLRMRLKQERSQLQSYLETVNSLSRGVLKLDFFNSIESIKYAQKVFEKIEKQYSNSDMDPMCLWLFEYIVINLEEPVNNGDVYEDFSNFDEDTDNEKQVKMEKDNNEQNKNENVCFTLDIANKEIKKLVSLYFNEPNLLQQCRLHREIATRRAQIRLFLEMRQFYSQQENLRIEHDVNPLRLRPEERWLLYFYWTDIIKEHLNRTMIDLKRNIAELIKDYEESRMILDCNLLADKQVIGMTTSGAARLRKLIQTLGPPIVIVEEAAEVLEQHIITSLTKKCQHLLLIGDHKQLRPSAAHMRLARHFNIEVSLFERMILNDVHSRRLNVQHRMRPEFAALLAPHIYPDLQNHPSVEVFPDVRGIATNLFFFTHDFKELAEQDNASKSNPKEADMVLLLANYIMQQGYEDKDVTILAAYSGQMFYMRKERPKYPHLAKVKMTLVDNYQGEESKIILLSLVRNNDNDKIGFLGTENRVCVALSRAREGFYMFGNINILKKNSDLWNTIDTILTNGEQHIGTSIPLRCENHRDVTTVISTAEDFQKVPEGGCLKRCEFLLSCGHQCPLICHFYDREHKEVKCKVDCERVCELNHVCRLKCWQECICEVIVTKEFPCKHKNDVRCYVNPEKANCHTVVDVRLPDCGHEAKKPCYVKINSVKCKIPCDYRLDGCGHTCARNCHVNNDPLHDKYVCRKPCARPNNGCSNTTDDIPEAHQCKKLCHEECDDCNVQILKKRTTCAHKETVACSKNLDEIKCRKNCTRMLACNHFCKKKCFEPCGDCDQMVSKEIPDCKHNIRIKCKLEPTRSMCGKKCERKLACGHACTGLCRDICDPSKCAARVATALDSPCGHKVNLPCAVFQNYKSDVGVLLEHCDAACGAVLECGHACGGRCADCRQGRLHVACNNPCGKRNFCGHECTQPCSKICPPCREKCEVKCMHSRCAQKCGATCTFCKEKCGRGCTHGLCNRRCSQPCSRPACEERCPRPLPCGHACRGFCGEPCPDICNICRPDNFPRDFLGDEFDDNAIFILLDDCGHILESEDMENLMDGDRETIGVRQCPFCRKPIINVQRYKDRIINIFKTEINPVKNKLYGKPKDVAAKRAILWKSLEDCEVAVKQTQTSKVTSFYRALLRSVDSNKKCDLQQLEMYSLILNIFEVLCGYCSDYYTSSCVQALRSEMDEQVSMICTYLERNVRALSVQQQQDLEKELKRVHAIINLSKVLTHPNFMSNKSHPPIAEAASNAKSVIFSCKIYNHDEATKALKHLEKIMKSNIVTAQERALVVKAIGLRMGHWFKCPNGHFYCIGECGGAMQESRCPDCGVPIGGRNHALLSSNRHAPEMDGSRYAAYSEEANNMANFDLDLH